MVQSAKSLMGLSSARRGEALRAFVGEENGIREKPSQEGPVYIVTRDLHEVVKSRAKIYK